jgi:hypothetical protein
LIGRSTNKNEAEILIRVRQAEISRRKRGVFRDRILEMRDALFEVSPSIMGAGLSFQVALINIGRDMTRGDKPGMFLSGDGYCDLLAMDCATSLSRESTSPISRS